MHIQLHIFYTNHKKPLSVIIRRGTGYMHRPPYHMRFIGKFWIFSRLTYCELADILQRISFMRISRYAWLFTVITPSMWLEWPSAQQLDVHWQRYNLMHWLRCNDSFYTWQLATTNALAWRIKTARPLDSTSAPIFQGLWTSDMYWFSCASRIGSWQRPVHFR